VDQVWYQLKPPVSEKTITMTRRRRRRRRRRRVASSTIAI
jgi:hypothetical protein